MKDVLQNELSSNGSLTKLRITVKFTFCKGNYSIAELLKDSALFFIVWEECQRISQKQQVGVLIIVRQMSDSDIIFQIELRSCSVENRIFSSNNLSFRVECPEVKTTRNSIVYLQYFKHIYVNIIMIQRFFYL